MTSCEHVLIDHATFIVISPMFVLVVILACIGWGTTFALAWDRVWHRCKEER